MPKMKVTPRMQKKRRAEEMAEALAKALERERMFEEQQRRIDWLRMLRDEMGLEEVFTLCTNPSLFASHADWQQDRLKEAWTSKVRQRKLEAVRALRPWPVGRMFETYPLTTQWPPYLCHFPDTPLRRGSSVSRGRYEALLSLREAGLFEEDSIALATLLGPPNRDYQLSGPGQWWSHVLPDEIWDETFLFSRTVDHLLPKALKDAMPSSSWKEDPILRESFIPLDVSKFPTLQAQGLKLTLVCCVKSGSGRYGVDLKVEGFTARVRYSHVFYLFDGLR